MAAGDEILAWKKANQERPPEPLTDCPDDGWPLEEKDGVKHCPFCGRVF